ncbi:HEPN domain-containing protein [Deltaproteobacteria bacterium TL4]
MDDKAILVTNWFTKAKHDLSVSKILKQNEQYLDVAIYHCQQAVEKSLKGFLT